MSRRERWRPPDPASTGPRPAPPVAPRCLPRGCERERLEPLGQGIGAGAERLRLRLELRVEGRDGRVHRGDRLLRSPDVLRFLQHAARAPRGGGGAPDGGHVDRLASQEGPQDGGPDRDRGLYSLLLDLLALARDRLLGAPPPLLERGDLGRVLLTKRLAGLVALLPRRLLKAHPKVPLGFARLRHGLE